MECFAFCSFFYSETKNKKRKLTAYATSFLTMISLQEFYLLLLLF